MVFPTPVGVFLTSKDRIGLVTGLPHARGGVSGVFIYKAFSDLSSPRPWGCFHCKSNQ